MTELNKRSDGRSNDALREIKFTRGWLNHAEGSVIVEFGQTRVLCAASFIRRTSTIDGSS